MIFFRFFQRKKEKTPIHIGFWETLRHKRPIFVLAPMADVTDCAFREIIAKYGKPDVFWTEFVSADGLANPRGREALIVDLKYGQGEHPIVAQIFGSNAESMEAAAKLCAELGFDGIDINMGCPDRSIEKSKSGAYSMKDPKLARRMLEAARRGAESSGRQIPVSVKTRIGYNNIDKAWIREVLSWRLPLVTFHLRTRKELSLVPAHWDFMKEIIAMRDEISPQTIVIGNGDAKDISDARMKAESSGADGVMLGRAIFGNPWLFADRTSEPSVREKLTVMLEHTALFCRELLSHKSFNIMKKHYKAYVNGFPGAKELRVRLMDAPTYEEVESIAREFLASEEGRKLS